MTDCVSPTCPRRGSCGRHNPNAARGADYSHGTWFRADDCFWFKPLQTTLPKRDRVGTVYGGKTLP